MDYEFSSHVSHINLNGFDSATFINNWVKGAYLSNHEVYDIL